MVDALVASETESRKQRKSTRTGQPRKQGDFGGLYGGQGLNSGQGLTRRQARRQNRRQARLQPRRAAKNNNAQQTSYGYGYERLGGVNQVFKDQRYTQPMIQSPTW